MGPSLKKLLAFLAAISIFATGSAATGLPQNRELAFELSSIGDRAVEDLRRCLSTNDALDVYYLIDMSGSLFDSPSRPGTDPNFARSEILGDSLRQLSNLATETGGSKAVSWNAGFFSNDFFPASSTWFDLDPSSVEGGVRALDAAIRESGGGATDWLVGVQGAQRELAKQKQVSKGCQVLIWLTDGGLNVRNDDNLSFISMNSLCGVAVVPEGGRPEYGLGPLYELRQSGVVVFGVLLDVVGQGISELYSERKSWLQPLVEGTGMADLPGGLSKINCGDGTGVIPQNHAAGAFIRAQQLGDLAVQFLRLSGLIQGGSLGSLASDGSFDINPGVARVELLSLAEPGALTLADPKGNVLSLSSPGVEVVQSAGASKVGIRVDSIEDFGKWRLTGVEPASVVLIAYSALSVNPEASNALISGQASEVLVIADVSDSELFSVSDYSFQIEAFSQTATGDYVSIGKALSSDLDGGIWRLDITPEATDTQVNLRFEATGIRTTVGGTRLSSIASEQSLVVSLPANFPTFGPIPLDLGTLQGRLNPATEVLNVYAPASGDVGYFCYGDDPNFVVQSDSIDRAATWNLQIAPAEGATLVDGCLEISPGSTTGVQLSLRNSETANSQVTGFVDFTLRDAAGAELQVRAPISLETQRIINPLVLALLQILFILLGVILPLVTIYLVNRFSSKVEHGNELLKAAFPVAVNLKTGEIRSSTNLDLKSSQVGLDHFKFQPPKADSRDIEVGGLGTAKAKVSANPLVAPWFEIEAKPESSVFTGKQNHKKGKRFATGAAAEFSGQLSKTWALSVNHSALRGVSSSTEDLPGTLVVFARNAGGVSPNFQERMIGVLNDAKVSGSILSAKEGLEALDKKNVSKKEAKDAGSKSGTKTPPGPSGPSAPRLGGPASNGNPASSFRPSTPGPSGPTGPSRPQTGPGGPSLPKPPSLS